MLQYSRKQVETTKFKLPALTNCVKSGRTKIVFTLLAWELREPRENFLEPALLILMLERNLILLVLATYSHKKVIEFILFQLTYVHSTLRTLS